MNGIDKNEYENARDRYGAEAKEKWGGTAAYKESEAKTAGYSKEKWSGVVDGMNRIFAEFAECKRGGDAANSQKAQALVKKLKEYITENFYNCTDEILAGLGQMYVCDERFKNNIDKAGDNTAEFVSEAIGIYCKK